MARTGSRRESLLNQSTMFLSPEEESTGLMRISVRWLLKLPSFVVINSKETTRASSWKVRPPSITGNESIMPGLRAIVRMA